MKKILHNKKKYYLTDICRLFYLFLGIVILWLIFALSLYLINYLINGYHILDIFSRYRLLSMHIVVISPVISYILCVIYYEKGWLSVKAILWLYCIITIITAVILFTFF